MKGTRKLSINGSYGIRIVAEIRSEQRPSFERIAAMERPKRGFKRAHNITRASDRGRVFLLVRTIGNFAYLGRE